jgi:hypothetical protein
MLFLPESVYRSRSRPSEDLGNGKPRPPYMELARVLEKQPGQEGFGPGLIELCMRKTLLDPEMEKDLDEAATPGWNSLTI